MYCYKRILEDLFWVGANDRRLAMFEGVYSVPRGVSYNSYLLLDEKTVLFDTVDKAVRPRFLENIAEALGDRPLDYLVVQHMEPDHSAALSELILRYPGIKLVCNAKTLDFIRQFFGLEPDALVVKEGDGLNTGRHELSFIMAPMVHWPEVMVTYDSASGTLFSADAFGAFGALNGAMFADEAESAGGYMDEARRYYANIVGKYGPQVQALLKKTAALKIETICPLHGFVWRRNLAAFVEKYTLWSSYAPEEKGVMIAYASVYGNTENAAELLAVKLREAGVQSVMYDVSVTPASEIIAAAFKWSHLVFASTTYNAGVFVTMEALISDLAAHNIQNRTVGIIENGSWAATAGGLIREKLSKCKSLNILGQSVSIRSGIKEKDLSDIEALAKAIEEDINMKAPQAVSGPAAIDNSVMFKLSYGLFVLTARDGGRDNGCIINTAAQVTDKPLRMSITVNKANLTHDMVLNSGKFNVCILDQTATMKVFNCFGFVSGRAADKFADCVQELRTANGLLYLPRFTNGVISASVIETKDLGTHTWFLADVTETMRRSDEKSLTYQYYFDNIKPRPQLTADKKKGYVCKICGYVYEGEKLPEDYVCPLCKHGPQDFEPIG